MVRRSWRLEPRKWGSLPKDDTIARQYAGSCGNVYRLARQAAHDRRHDEVSRLELACLPLASSMNAAAPLPNKIPVAIAGGGPVGLSLAALLGHHGVPCLVLEADASWCEGSRAICLSRRSQEI